MKGEEERRRKRQNERLHKFSQRFLSLTFIHSELLPTEDEMNQVLQEIRTQVQ